MNRGDIAAAFGRLREWWSKGDFQRRTANATVLLAIGTFLLALFGIIQLMLFRSQERHQLRAYVGVIIKLTPSVNPFVPPQVPQIDFDVRNSGMTPAYDVTHISAADLMSYPLPKDFDFSKAQPAIGSSPEPITIFPGTLDNLGIEAKTSRAFTPDELASVATGTQKRVYFWGTVNYRDAFGEYHFTHFCLGYYGTVASIRHEPCERHNDAD
jgi:hypothetical protein